MPAGTTACASNTHTRGRKSVVRWLEGSPPWAPYGPHAHTLSCLSKIWMVCNRKHRSQHNGHYRQQSIRSGKRGTVGSAGTAYF